MENSKMAVCEGAEQKDNSWTARKCFYKVYSYLLYQDTAGLLEALDYRHSLRKEERQHERYLVFRYMLRLLRERHPDQYVYLNPA